jgi:undecaprenyl diphosphate synthase
MVLNIAVNYGGRAEIIQAVQGIARDVLSGRLAPEEIDESALSGRLWTAGIPDPDLVIRASGEQRLSNFLLWQAAYAELYLTPVLWPDFGVEEFHKALLEYQKRARRFGGL